VLGSRLGKLITYPAFYCATLNYANKMDRKIDLAVRAVKGFINVTHCDNRDSCSVGVFNDTILWVSRLASRKAEIKDCLDLLAVNADTEPAGTPLRQPRQSLGAPIYNPVRRDKYSGGTRLYDSLCDSADYLLEHGDKSRPWIVVAVTHESDNKSTRSADECRNYILERFDKRRNSSVFIISVGKDTDRNELQRIAEQGCLHHIPVTSFSRLENALMSISFGEIGSIQSAIDHVIIINASPSMGLPEPTQDPSIGTPSRLVVQKSRLGVPVRTRDPDSESLLTQSKQPSRAGGLGVMIREFSNSDLHPDDRQIFREFASENYPGVNNSWEEGGIEFLVLVGSRMRRIVGLLVMLPYDGDKIHIRLMAVDKECRKLGLGSMMLTHVAAKYPNKKVTLNIAYDRLDLLEFYCDKGLAKLEGVSTKHKVLMLYLDHLSIFAKMPLPERST
jgi:GNAT superfamily N-acetyltransferase